MSGEVKACEAANLAVLHAGDLNFTSPTEQEYTAWPVKLGTCPV